MQVKRWFQARKKRIKKEGGKERRREKRNEEHGRKEKLIKEERNRGKPSWKRSLAWLPSL